MIIRSAIKSNGKTVNLFIFYFTMVLINPGFQSSFCFSNVNMILRTTRNEIDTIAVLIGMGFLLTGLKETLKPNCGRILEILTRDGRIKRQNDRIKTRVKVRKSMFRLLKFVKNFGSDKGGCTLKKE